MTRRSILPFAFDGWRRKYRGGRNIRSVCKGTKHKKFRTSVRALVVCRSRREREEAKFCSGKVRAASIVIVFLLVCRSIREYVFLIVCHSRCVREKAFEDSAPGRCGVSSDRNECVFFRKLFRGSIFKMALYHGGENDVEFVLSCSTLRDPSPTSEDADLEGVLMGYPNISPAPFTNLVAIKKICLARSKRLIEGTQTPQYLAFTGVSQESLDEIDRTREKRRGWLPRMTILYDGREQILIVKLMVGVMHEGVANEFSKMFDIKSFCLGVDGLLFGTGSSRFGRRGGKSKEGDLGYKPHSRPMIDG
ncbi:unnamed protein product [Sphagnum troendelagicum]|uniref:Uncharacterized protein n=1 Tax=Sphagnum troendelagicum TaxID=128251 RepID=A0ABP0T7F5_9BRYO